MTTIAEIKPAPTAPSTPAGAEPLLTPALLTEPDLCPCHGKRVKILIVGDSGVGKTSLIESWMKKDDSLGVGKLKGLNKEKKNMIQSYQKSVWVKRKDEFRLDEKSGKESGRKSILSAVSRASLVELDREQNCLLKLNLVDFSMAGSLPQAEDKQITDGSFPQALINDHRRMQDLVSAHFMNATASIVCLDLSDRNSYEGIENWVEDLQAQ